MPSRKRHRKNAHEAKGSRNGDDPTSRRLSARLTGGASALARAVIGDGPARRARIVTEQAGRGVRTVRDDLQDLKGQIRRFGTDMRGVGHDVRRVGQSMRRTGSDLGSALRRTATALLGLDGREPKPETEAGAGESHRPPERPRGGTARPGEKPPFPTPQPEHLRAARSPASRKKGPAARGKGRKSIPGTIGQDPRWGA